MALIPFGLVSCFILTTTPDPATKRARRPHHPRRRSEQPPSQGRLPVRHHQSDGQLASPPQRLHRHRHRHHHCNGWHSRNDGGRHHHLRLRCLWDQGVAFRLRNRAAPRHLRGGENSVSDGSSTRGSADSDSDSDEDGDGLPANVVRSRMPWLDIPRLGSDFSRMKLENARMDKSGMRAGEANTAKALTRLFPEEAVSHEDSGNTDHRGREYRGGDGDDDGAVEEEEGEEQGDDCSITLGSADDFDTVLDKIVRRANTSGRGTGRTGRPSRKGNEEPHLAIAALVIKAHPEELCSWACYHLIKGFKTLLLYFDNPVDPIIEFAKSRFANDSRIHIIPCDRQHFEEVSRGNPTLFHDLSQFTSTHVEARRIFVADRSIREARKRNSSWLLHVDFEELFFLPGRTTAFDYFSRIPPRVRQVRFLPVEGVPSRLDVLNRFKQVYWFKANPLHVKEEDINELWPQRMRRTGTLGGYFRYCSYGKSAVRLNQEPNERIEPLGVFSSSFSSLF